MCMPDNREQNFDGYSGTAPFTIWMENANYNNFPDPLTADADADLNKTDTIPPRAARTHRLRSNAGTKP